MKEIMLGCWLGILAWSDYKKKEIPVSVVVVGAVIGIGFCIAEMRSVTEVMIACLPGIGALGFSRLSREKMGYGDGIVLGIMGLYLSFRQLISVGLQAFGVAGAVALILLVVFHKNGNYRIPFLPFLGIAYGFDWMVRIGEW